MTGVRMFGEPFDRADEALRQHLDVEAQLRGAGVDGFLARRQQIEEERAEVRAAQFFGDVSIARAETAAPAAMGEQDDARRATRNDEVPLQFDRIGADMNQSFFS